MGHAIAAIEAVIVILGALALFVWFCLSRPKFGALPKGERLERIKRSPNFQDGEFANIEPAPTIIEGSSHWEMIKASFKRPKSIRPPRPLPSLKPNLPALADERLVWFGHSSFLIKAGGKTLLFDPVLSRSASPVPFLNKAFKLEREVEASDFPAVDCLFLSHDHWDHLDYPTIMALKARIGAIVAPLGLGAHLERWGFSGFCEGDWGDSFEPCPGLKVQLVPARHFGGRGPVWRRSFWAGFALEAGGRKIFYSGDSGYGRHFREAGERLGPFDLAVLECGQYDRLWAPVHMTPEETAQAAADLGAKAAMPVHCARFVISRHDWDDPLIRFAKAVEELNSRLSSPIRAVTPVIGAEISPFDQAASYGRWWEAVKP